MKIYVAYKLNREDLSKLKIKLEKINSIIKELGHESFIFVRDMQNWIPDGSDPAKIMRLAMENMKKCDMILTVVETQEKGEGLLLESGFMKGLGKKLVIASTPTGRGILLKGMADYVFEYNDFDEFKEKLEVILKKFD